MEGSTKCSVSTEQKKEKKKNSDFELRKFRYFERATEKQLSSTK